MDSRRIELSPRIREIIARHGELGVSVERLSDTSDLYEAGMASRATVSVMLALEGEFGVEFPDSLLRRDVFQSILSIEDAVASLLAT